MNKKTTVLVLMITVCAVAFARPHGGAPRAHAAPRPHAPRHHVPHRPHHHGCAGAFWTGVVGGVVGGTLVDVVTGPRVVAPAPVVVTPAPVVVAAPAVQTQNVWVEGRYVDQVQPNGTVVRVWQPGHYEQRTVVVQ